MQKQRQGEKAVITLTTLTHDPPVTVLRVQLRPFGHILMGRHPDPPTHKAAWSPTQRLFLATQGRLLGAENRKSENQRPQIRNPPHPEPKRRRGIIPDSKERAKTLLLTCDTCTPIPHTPNTGRGPRPTNLHLEKCTEHRETLYQEENHHHKKETRHSAIAGNFFQQSPWTAQRLRDPHPPSPQDCLSWRTGQGRAGTEGP